MTHDEIIRFAIQCNLVTTGNRDGLYMDALTEFANLVAAKALAQTQEPVAWMKRINMPGDDWDAYDFSVNQYGDFQTPLYTTPPQRTWVGLTNDELTDLFYNTNLGQQSAVAQAIALLKEHNT